MNIVYNICDSGPKDTHLASLTNECAIVSENDLDSLVKTYYSVHGHRSGSGTDERETGIDGRYEVDKARTATERNSSGV